MGYRPLRTLLLYAVFFLSGLCGLGHQIVWSRMLGIGLGHELPAVLAVVAAFFAGVALGAWSLDRWIGRSLRPGRWYAILEIVIGVWGLLLMALLPLANDFDQHLIGLAPSATRHWLAAFVVPFFVLLPATASMGATLPAMERFLSPVAPDEKCIGTLYAVNTLGAVWGTLLSTFLVVPALGFTRSLALLAGMNVLCGVAVLCVEGPVEKEEWKGWRIASEFPARRLNPMLFLTGALGIGYEVLGVRVLAEVLENTIYSFAASLSIYLLGTAIGAGLYQRFGRAIGFRELITVQLYGLSTSCILGTFFLARAQKIYDQGRALFGDSLCGVLGAEMTVAAIVFGMPTILMGATFSHLVQSSRGENGGVGRALALNTLGSALAPGLFGVLLLPILGAKWSLATLSLAYLLLLPRLSVTHGLATILPVALVWLLPSRVQMVQPPPGGKVLEYREGVMDSVAVVEHFDGHKSLLVNNRFTMGGTGAADAASRHAHIPLLLHPDPRRALFLGLGTGITFGASGLHPGLRADGVELVPEIRDVLHYFEPYNALRPGMEIHVADARRFVRVAGQQYDVIVADLFHPARDGAGALYTREHFQAIRKRLAPGGLFCQWLPLYQLDEAMLRVIVRTCLQVFPHTHAFMLRFNVDTPVLGLIGRLEPTFYPHDWFEQRVQNPELIKGLRSLSLMDGLHLFGCFLAGPQALRDFSGTSALNTDDRPVVLFRAPEFAYRRDATPHGRLLTLLDRRASDPDQLIEQNGTEAAQRFGEKLRAFIAARDVYLNGLIAEGEGRPAQALEAYLESARTSTNFSTAYARCLTMAVQQSKAKPEEARRLLERLAEAQPARPVAQELLRRMFKE